MSSILDKLIINCQCNECRNEEEFVDVNYLRYVWSVHGKTGAPLGNASSFPNCKAFKEYIVNYVQEPFGICCYEHKGKYGDHRSHGSSQNVVWAKDVKDYGKRNKKKTNDFPRQPVCKNRSHHKLSRNKSRSNCETESQEKSTKNSQRSLQPFTIYLEIPPVLPKPIVIVHHNGQTSEANTNNSKPSQVRDMFVKNKNKNCTEEQDYKKRKTLSKKPTDRDNYHTKRKEDRTPCTSNTATKSTESISLHCACSVDDSRKKKIKCYVKGNSPRRKDSKQLKLAQGRQEAGKQSIDPREPRFTRRRGSSGDSCGSVRKPRQPDSKKKFRSVNKPSRRESGIKITKKGNPKKKIYSKNKRSGRKLIIQTASIEILGIVSDDECIELYTSKNHGSSDKQVKRNSSCSSHNMPSAASLSRVSIKTSPSSQGSKRSGENHVLKLNSFPSKESKSYHVEDDDGETFIDSCKSKILRGKAKVKNFLRSNWPC